ncbi:MAG: branched-chain amino acid ABC transporter permease [Parasporobacterium sp.]|nr:branched-chain amino acid ABC transporter permease [Parasporobacterium sp.]
MTKKNNAIIRKNIIILVIFLAVFSLLPLVMTQNYLTSMMVQCFLFAAMGVAWNLIGGYADRVSIGHSAFLAVGAYTSYIMYLDFGISPLIGMFVGMIIAGVLAYLIGSLCLGLRGTFFTLSTIAFAEIFKNILLHFREVTNGSYGLILTYSGDDPVNLQFGTKTPIYYISLVLLAAIVLFNIFFEKSKTGYCLKAIGEDEDAIRSLGFNTRNVKLRTFIISAMLTSLIGTIYGFYLAYIMPTSIASTPVSIKIIVVAVIGGAGLLWGPVLGAFIIIPLTELVNATLGSISGANTMIYGLVLILIILFRPKGVLSLFIEGGWVNKKIKSLRKIKTEV